MIQSVEEQQHEESLIKDFILLPMLLTVVDNIHKKEVLFDKTQEILIDGLTEALMNLYRYIRGGYTEMFTLNKKVAKAELSVKLGYYVNELIKRLK
jgi:hypothetical protein